MYHVALIILIGFAMVPVVAQLYDTDPTLGVMLDNASPHHHKSDDGRTVVIGEVLNTEAFPVSGVRIWAGFFDEDGEPVESTIATSLLEMIPPHSMSPYVIFSESRDPSISYVDVSILGFAPAGSKPQDLILEGAALAARQPYQASITNNAQFPSEETRVHVIVHDIFEPPRLLDAETIRFNESIDPGSSIEFEFEPDYSPPASGFYMVAESRHSHSNVLNVEILEEESAKSRVVINDVSAVDPEGDDTTLAAAGHPVSIRAEIRMLPSENHTQEYVYYTQVKRSGEAFVEHIGVFEGRFSEPGNQSPTIQWIPRSPGIFFIETFVWDPSGAPLAPMGPISAIVVE